MLLKYQLNINVIDGQDGRDILLVNAWPIPKESIDRWARQMNTEYNNLLESEKISVS